MNKMRALDTVGSTLTVEAGCILESVQKMAIEAGKLFPLSLAAEGSAQIGGVLATNAGGTAVLKYGNARDLVLGIEVVLADGAVWNGLRSLRKDNTGYDLRNLFIGSEGTLGIITAATLKLFPLPRQVVTAVAALGSADDALALLKTLTAELGDRLTAFEVFDASCLGMVVAHHPDLRSPFGAPHAWYALVELSETSAMVPLEAMAEQALGLAIEAGSVADVVIATSGKKADDLWKLRESITEAQKREAYTLKHDISVPIARIPQFLVSATAALAAQFPGIAIAPFGHLGDGNIHFNVRPPALRAGQDAAELEHAIAAAIYGAVRAADGSFSAEHGVGQLKTGELAHYKSAQEMALFRALKLALDPQQSLNPGKVLASQALSG